MRSSHPLRPSPANAASRQQAAYRRLAVAILGLDVATLTRDLRKRDQNP